MRLRERQVVKAEGRAVIERKKAGERINEIEVEI